jgi:multidrug efflux pump subunit AcrB
MFDRIIRLSITNPVFTNLLFFVIVGVGLVMAARLPKEQFPEVSLDRVAITTVYPGATASDVEELVTRPVEDGLEDVSDVKKVESTSGEGVSTVVVTFLQGTDIQDARSEVEKAVSAVDTLPADAETPVVRELKLELPVVTVALVGNRSDSKLVDRLQEELRDLPGVASVALSGVSEPKIYVDLDEVRLRELGLGPSAIAAAITGARASVPAGTVELRGTDIAVKTEQRLQSAADVARIPIAPGSKLRLGDVADVRAAPDPAGTLFWVDGVGSVKLTVSREESADPLTIRKAVIAKLPELETLLPEGTRLVISDDQTSFIRDRLRTVAENALQGAALVVLVLLWMSGLRQALLAIWGMPVSYLFATTMMETGDITVNVISTFGLLIATGIIVDDSIVIIENVQRHMEMGKDRVTAAYEGTREVIIPVFAAVFTTVVAFMPLTLVSGTMGRVMKILPLVVVFCLLGSLLEALFILPGHLAEFASRDAGEGRTARLGRRLQAIYRPPLRWCIHHKWLTLLLVALSFAATLGVAARMPFQLQAPGKPFTLKVGYELMPGTSKEVTKAAGDQIIAGITQDLGDHIAHVSLRVGSSRDDQTGLETLGSNVGNVSIEFRTAENGALPAELLTAYPAAVRGLRMRLATNPELGTYKVTEVQAGPPTGAAVTVRVRGRDRAELDAAVVAMKQLLESYPGVFDIRDDQGQGKETFRVRVNQDRAALYGLTELQVGQAVRAAVDGLVAQEVSIDEEQVEIIVRYADGQARTRAGLADLLLTNARGETVRLDQVAAIERTREIGAIKREDFQRTISVLAEVDPAISSGLAVAAKVQEDWGAGMSERYPETTLLFGGDADEISESLADLPALFAVAVGLIYTILALQFGSYIQPFIILVAVPFGMMGAVLGLTSLGYPLSLFAMFGIVALAGIVVNDSLVMVDRINSLRTEERMALPDAVFQGALDRLRPILSTTLTTVLGLAPIAIGIGGKDEILAPMAVSIAMGLSVATTLVLLVVPPIYLVVEQLRLDVTRGLRAIGIGGHAPEAAVAPPADGDSE